MSANIMYVNIQNMDVSHSVYVTQNLQQLIPQTASTISFTMSKVVSFGIINKFRTTTQSAEKMRLFLKSIASK